MEDTSEIQSFLLKFNQLWKSGHEAELSLNCNAGKAFLNLKVELGNYNEVKKKSISPSQLRRKIRRENNRKNSAQCVMPSEKDVDNSTESEGNDHNINEYSEDNTVVDVEAEEVATIKSTVVTVDSKDMHIINENSNCNVVQANNLEDSSVEEVGSVVLEPVLNSQALQSATNVIKKEDDATQERVNCSEPDIVTVYALATIKKSPCARLAEDELASVGRFITSEEHLRKNIANIHYDEVYCKGVDINGTYEHSVQIRIQVRRCNLWQGARAYIWKHLGSDIWERSNGSTIMLTRIHQK